MEAVDYEWNTPLLHAAHIGHTGTAVLLLEQGANFYTVGKLGKSSLQLVHCDNHAAILSAIHSCELKAKVKSFPAKSQSSQLVISKAAVVDSKGPMDSNAIPIVLRRDIEVHCKLEADPLPTAQRGRWRGCDVVLKTVRGDDKEAIQAELSILASL